MQDLITNITPGAVGELYKVLGRPLYTDKTWTKGNTIRIYPNKYSRRVQVEGVTEGDKIPGNLTNMRPDTQCYVKNVMTGNIEGRDDLMFIKLECMISGSVGL